MDSYNIITHSETFHVDEVVGCAMLKYLRPVKIWRMRDQQFIDSVGGYIILDVGKVYDPSPPPTKSVRLDHHQSSFSLTYDSNSKIPLSSCGLVWLHYGQQIVRKFVTERSLNLDTEDQKNIVRKF